jgi:hypothetical protein
MSLTLDLLKKKLDSLTKISVNDRQKSFRWLSRQNDIVGYDIFKLQKNYFHRLKSQNTDDDLILLSVASLFLAIKDAILSSQMPKRKNKNSDFGFLRQVAKNRAKQFRKARQKVKHEKLLTLQAVIIGLIENEKYSYREVVQYLLKYHKLGVSHTTIGLFYRKFKEDKNG